MKSIKYIVRRNLLWFTAMMMVTILIIALFFQVLACELQARDNADAMFLQIKQIMTENSKELASIEAEYRETCLLNAEAISYMIEHNPKILETEYAKNGKGEMCQVGTAASREEFRMIAQKLEIDEIHIFDDKGSIFTGTHHEYTGYNFDDGEQIGFFKPMLENKSLRLCQDIMPNTADQRVVQYSCIWSSDGKYIIQVGMYPDAVLDVTEKNELSYIFSLLQGPSGVTMYAVNTDSGEIVGATATQHNGKAAIDIGIDPYAAEKFASGAHLKANGVNSYAIYTNIDDMIIVYVIADDQLYSNVGLYSLMLAICLFVIAIVLVWVVVKYTDKYIIGGIAATNEKLRAIKNGNLDERADVKNSLEFSELSDHINSMILSLLSDTDKMSLVLNRTNLRVAVYEYSPKMKHARFTDHMPEIFGLTVREMIELASDHTNLQDFIDELRKDPVESAENTFRYKGRKEKYIKLEEIMGDRAVLGIVIDVTDEIESRMRAETERDYDLMTGLYNRRSMDRIFNGLFSSPSDMGYGAIIMLDCDNLKVINDTYGHPAGDSYLVAFGDILARFDAPKQVSVRTGGDEFVLLIYGYKNDSEVLGAIDRIKSIQKNASVTLNNGKIYPLMFSFGYELIHGRSDYNEMLSTADAHMYNSKRERKLLAERGNNAVE